jgi:hypothetical protein
MGGYWGTVGHHFFLFFSLKQVLGVGLAAFFGVALKTT